MIKNLAFKGGGILGMAYAGSIKALEENNMIDSIENIAGTSVGAVTAMALAIGCSSSELNDFLTHSDFKKIKDHWNILNLSKKYGIYNGDFLFNWIKSLLETKSMSPTITFRELNEIRQKNLRVFATNISTIELEEFSFKHTPDIPIAEAVRASMSIPLFFQAWKFSDKTLSDYFYIDGGTMLNYPLSVFDNLKESIGLYMKTDTDVSKKLGSNHLSDFIKHLYKANMKSQDVVLFNNEDFKNHSIIIDGLGISSTSFDLSKNDIDKLYMEGYQSTKVFLHNLSV